jgi:hypothetical protein|tara:strand:+ start:467 stop:778 length:312 start_codon:yes stop_codon:yes gene_type:complete
MDERSKKEEDIYLGVYHPYPKEAPKSWRMARMKQLRKEVLLKRQQKEKSKMNWLKDRVKEMSSWSGASLIVLGAFIILGGPFIKLLAWAAIIWGIVSIVKKEG